ncbi:MAG: hypothetical protein R3B54_02095 [Bdellovibrionota bacterium]
MRTLRYSLFLLLSSVVLAAPKAADPQLVLKEVVPDGSGFEFRAVISNPPEESASFEVLTEEGQSLGSIGSGTKEAVNLWVLVDSSTLCRKNNIDERVNRLTRKLKSHLDSDSLVSLVSYTNTTLEIHHNHRPVREMEDSIVSCDNTLLSTTFEKPLEHLLTARESSELPTVVWVFTSGNIDLSKEVLAQLKKRNAEVHIALYNPFVASEIRPVLSDIQASLGKENVRFSVIASDSPVLPEMRRRLSFSPPYELRGKRVRVRLQAVSGEKTVQSSPFNLSVPEGNVFLERYLRMVLWMGLALLALWLGYRLVRSYRTKVCADCGRTRRHTDPGCLFCLQDRDAFLIGSFNVRDKHKLGHSDLVRLVGDSSEIGTHRRSVVSLVKSTQKRRACYVTIIREALPKNRYAYRLVRNASDSSIQISVNSNPIRKDRYLSSGDVLQIDGVEFSFYSGMEDSDVA